MAVTPTKKAQGTPEPRWGMWLHDSGMLSFGMGIEGEMVVPDQKVYDFLKSLPQETRWVKREDWKEKPAEPVVETAPVGPPDVEQGLGPDSEGHPGTEGPPGEPAVAAEVPQETPA